MHSLGLAEDHENVYLLFHAGVAFNFNSLTDSRVKCKQSLSFSGVTLFGTNSSPCHNETLPKSVFKLNRVLFTHFGVAGLGIVLL